jgi:hypothetical protein
MPLKQEHGQTHRQASSQGEKPGRMPRAFSVSEIGEEPLLQASPKLLIILVFYRVT